MKPKDDVPIVLFDGECPFCRRWAARLERRTGARVRYEPFQNRGAALSGLDESRLRRRLHLLEPGGRVRQGADAVFFALSRAPGFGWLSLPSMIPGFSWAAERVYDAVARLR